MKVWSLIALFFSFSSYGNLISSKFSDYRIQKEYLKIHKQFSNAVCKGSDRTYDSLYKKFRGEGYFVPVQGKTKLDKEAISKNLPLLEDKIVFINRAIKRLKTFRSFKIQQRHIRKLEKSFKNLQKVKSDYYQSARNKEEILIDGSEKLKHFKKVFLETQNLFFFLMPYRFPVDHLQMRKDYDYYKTVNTTSGQKRKNDIFFRRKIFEDGSQDPKTRASDTFIRTLINSLGLRLQNEGQIISENFRYDFEYLLKVFKKVGKRRPKYYLVRLQEWENRTSQTLRFYRQILSSKNSTSTKEAILRKSEAQFRLKNFTLEKQAEVYEFWENQTELMRSIFALETILFNEVGDIDGKEALERGDVSQVVLNRVQIPFYRSLTESDSIYEYLIRRKLSQNIIRERIWLNALFKEGEFSFTYFFISASKNIYCPDMSKRGRYLRKKNVEIVINQLRNPKYDFKGVRYFSRASMVGRIDMSSIWSKYQRINERPGRKLGKMRKFVRLFENDKYDYLYEFKDPKDVEFLVLKFGEKVYVKTKRGNKFFSYRNPHYFTYFFPK